MVGFCSFNITPENALWGREAPHAPFRVGSEFRHPTKESSGMIASLQRKFSKLFGINSTFMFWSLRFADTNQRGWKDSFLREKKSKFQRNQAKHNYTKTIPRLAIRGSSPHLETQTDYPPSLEFSCQKQKINYYPLFRTEKNLFKFGQDFSFLNSW